MSAVRESLPTANALLSLRRRWILWNYKAGERQWKENQLLFRRSKDEAGTLSSLRLWQSLVTRLSACSMASAHTPCLNVPPRAYNCRGAIMRYLRTRAAQCAFPDWHEPRVRLEPEDVWVSIDSLAHSQERPAKPGNMYHVLVAQGRWEPWFSWGQLVKNGPVFPVWFLSCVCIQLLC